MTPLALVIGGLWALLGADVAYCLPGAKRLPTSPVAPLDGTALPPHRPPTGEPRRSPTRRRLRHGLVGTLVLLFVQPQLAPLPVAAALVWSLLDDRRQRHRRESAVIDQLPDLVDLLRLTTLAGLPVSAGLRAIGGRPGGVVGAAVAQSAHLLDRGATTARALEALTAGGGPSMRPLVDALADHDRYGTPLGPGLERVGIESRLHRRRRAEEAARRLPVTLLFPLVLTTLPAFVLLTIIPLLMGSFSSLPL